MKKTIVKIIFLLTVIVFYSFISYREINYILKNTKAKRNQYISSTLSTYDINTKNGNIDISTLEDNNNDSHSALAKVSEVTDQDEINKQIEQLNTDIKSMKVEQATLTEELNTSKSAEATKLSEYNKAKSDYDYRMNNHYISNVPTINQYPNYPTGCESIALLILLRYYNVDVTAEQIVNILPKGSLPYYEDSILYGGNPYIEFVGDPRNSYSFGNYDIPLQNTANTFKSGIINASGTSLNDILNIVKQNRPVLVWSSINLGTPFISNTWIYKPTNTTINWYSGEHAVVIIGFSPDKIIISDPINGTIRYQNRNTFESRYNYFGKRALYY